MKVIDPSFELIDPPRYQQVLNVIEMAGRTCYQSAPKGDPETFVRSLIKSGHHSVIEHISLTAKIVCDRGVSHELVRHRLCSFSQESTRYCNYSKGKFGGEITVLSPFFWTDSPGGFSKKSKEFFRWEQAMLAAEHSYLTLLNWGATAQEARSVLPNSLATTVIMTANLREWRHILKLRCSKAAHPQMREVMLLGFDQCIDQYPVFFDDIEVYRCPKK